MEFAGRLVMPGFGRIGQATLPLLLRHIAMRPEQVPVVNSRESELEAAREYGVPCLVTSLDADNLRQVLVLLLEPGDFLLNPSVDVSSVALLALARERGALNLDNCIEPWAGGYLDPWQFKNFRVA